MLSIEFKFPQDVTVEDVDAALRDQLGDRLSGITMYSTDAPAVVWLQESAMEKEVQLVKDILSQPIPHVVKKVKKPASLSELSLDEAKVWVQNNTDDLLQVRETLTVILEALYTKA